MKKIGFWGERNKIGLTIKLFIITRPTLHHKEILKPKMMKVRIIRSSMPDVKDGNNTKIEPSVKPIIPAKVILWNLSKRNFVNFIKTKQPKSNPIPIGIKILKDNEEIPFK